MTKQRKNPLREGVLAVGYVRVSTKEQKREGISLDAQEDRVRSYCTFRGLELAGIYREEAVSAGIPLANRPQGGQLIERLSSGDVANVVSVKIDRLFRNVQDCLYVLDSWVRAGISLHLVDLGGQSVDTSTAMGKLFVTMVAAIAEWERGMISERITDALQFKLAQGETVGAAPLGYRWEGEMKHMRLVANPAEQEALCKIVEWRANHHSLREIVAMLNESGIPARTAKSGRGGKWHLATVVRVLKRLKSIEG